MEKLASTEGAIADAFSDNSITELETEQQQIVFEELLKYNVKYLEEKRRLRERQGKINQI